MKLKILQEIYEDGKKEQKEKESIEIAKRMIKRNYSITEIIEIVQISEEKLQTLL